MPDAIAESMLFAGIVAGIAGCLAMDALSRARSWTSTRRGHSDALTHQGGRPDVEEAKERESVPTERVATVKTANAVAKAAGAGPLTPAEYGAGGAAVHYAFGIGCALLYAALRQRFPAVGAVHGAAYGAAIWLGGVEVLLPLLGLSKPGWRYPASLRAYSLLSHTAYGTAVEAVTKRMAGGAAR